MNRKKHYKCQQAAEFPVQNSYDQPLTHQLFALLYIFCLSFQNDKTLSLAPHSFTRKTKKQYIINQNNTYFINCIIIIKIKPSCFRAENVSSEDWLILFSICLLLGKALCQNLKQSVAHEKPVWKRCFISADATLVGSCFPQEESQEFCPGQAHIQHTAAVTKCIHQSFANPALINSPHRHLQC